VLAGACLGLDVYRRYREREVIASALEAQLARAQLSALRAQLHPHFLFNALNTISALIPRDPSAADRMIERLGELLRRSLDAEGAAEVPLEEELRFLDGYLEIERARFRDRLAVTTRVDPGTMRARVPSLILQPLVENAIRHGVAPRAAPGSVEIRAEHEDGVLRLVVKDDGPGEPAPGGHTDGVGLANTRARLRRLYGASHRFQAGNAPGGGFEASVTIPFRTTGSEAADVPAGGHPADITAGSRGRGRTESAGPGERP
jgi:LytS/YehU family sensor histidine kinase